MAHVKLEERDRAVARGPLFYVGAIGLLLAMSVEAVAVLGRHIGVPFFGALELIQTAILMTASAAMVTTTISNTHARVTLLTERIGPNARSVLNRISAFLSALFFCGLAAGALWLTVDAWNEYEQSELLHIPFRPLRVISVAAAVAIAVLFLRELFKRSDRS
ncbi:MAG TPA: TRAP transporter small permease subunit [Steroidobacteraceae bacterium]|jgi:TRAP-type C4-dicarboxylate transport system permease small subunit|nr:TRAP transporter small permease subunit [Steroidobacteraceae bacterium]